MSSTQRIIDNSRAPSPGDRPIMFWNKLCPFVHKSWIVAVEKGAPIDLCYIPLGEAKPAWYTAEVNPRGTVPSLMLPKSEGGTVLLESQLVAQYLDETYGEIPGSLQAGSAVQKQQMRVFIDAVGGAVGAMYGLLMAQENLDEKKKNVNENLDWLEKLLTRRSETPYFKANPGPFFLGQQFSLADVTVLPFLDRFRNTLAAYRDYDIFEGRPQLLTLIKGAEARPSFALTSQPGDFYVEVYSGYAKTPANLEKIKGKLYCNPVCPFASRTMLANALKGKPLEEVHVDLPLPEWYTKDVYDTTPAVKLPDGTILGESNFIVQYIDESSANKERSLGPNYGKNLQPESPIEKYKTRFFLEQFDGLPGAIWMSMSGKNEEAIQKAIKLLGELNGAYTNGKGPFFLGGEEATYADVVTLPFWVRAEALYAVVLAKQNGDKAFDEAFPALARTIAAARSDERLTPVLQDKATFVENQKKKLE